MKKLLLSLVLLFGLVGQALAYDITFENNVVKIKKSAIKQIYMQYGEFLDPYQNIYRTQGFVSFKFLSGLAEPNGWNLVLAYRNYHGAPSGEENITYDGEYVRIPFSAFSGSGKVQCDPTNWDHLKDELDNILPFSSSGSGGVGWFPRRYHTYWIYSN